MLGCILVVILESWSGSNSPANSMLKARALHSTDNRANAYNPNFTKGSKYERWWRGMDVFRANECWVLEKKAIEERFEVDDDEKERDAQLKAAKEINEPNYDLLRMSF
ncbi:hypothetical protein T492DRAFT_72673 [Pavlovales sp. CCMP2436]|nr:hypothetical protein T492DRAFT_72673 [Pavlovales sp. CCMP2436]